MAERYGTRIYVATDLSRSDVVALFAGAVAGRVERSSVVGQRCVIDVRRNDEYDPRPRSDADAFLYFPLTVEVWTEDPSVSLKSYLSTVASVMQALAANGSRLVAACDWEHLLPGGGRLGF
ncbi:MAG: hypothetical protein HMLKMBBP_00716 [Planctomycetes bacterium]|nr:hypothetical protein [Planctomycetota bacterium]